MNLDLSHATFYHDGKFPPERLNYNRLLSSLLEATDALARYDQMLQGMFNSEIFLAPLRNQEAVLSSRMEGTISTMDEILLLEAEYGDNLPAHTETRSDSLETFLYQRSLRAAQAQVLDGRPLSASLIKSIHQHLLSVGRGSAKSPGAYKTEQNYIGERGSRRVSFVPIAPEKLESGIEKLFEVASDSEIPVLLRAALVHVEFEALHPFNDGNGRVGRMLIPLLLWAKKAISAPHFYISRYFEEHKDEYIAKMRAVSANDAWEDWCVFFLTAVKEQAIHNLETVNRVNTLYETMKERFSKLLSSKWSIVALDFVFGSPVFYNSRFTQEVGIPTQTASRFSRLLLQEGLLRTVRESSGRISAIYSFEPLLELVRI